MPELSTPQRWTGHVTASEHGGFVAYGDYLKLERENAELRAALEKARIWTWQPIETAPKDCTVLLRVPTRAGKWNKTLPLAGWWEGREDADGFWIIFNADEALQRVEPTHWMPLPKQPVEAMEPPAP